MTLYEYILDEKKRLEDNIRDLHKRMDNCPPGSLVVQKNGSRYKFYHQLTSDNSKEKTLVYLRKTAKDQEMIQQLAIKKMLRMKLINRQNEIKSLDAYISIHDKNQEESNRRDSQAAAVLAAVGHNFPEYPSKELSDLLTDFNSFPGQPHFRTDTELSKELTLWQQAEYSKNPLNPEGLIIPSARNEMVRSKSEAFIAISLDAHNIPYRYECALPLKYNTVYPDFTIRHPLNGKLIIWEHFGMMDDPEYAGKTAKKIKQYIQEGFIPNKTLFMTFESDERPLDFREVTFIIEEMILRTW